MPNAHGLRLTEAFHNSRLVKLANCYTLISEDQPELLAAICVSSLAEGRPFSLGLLNAPNSLVRYFESS
jgi:hypothetical protein